MPSFFRNRPLERCLQRFVRPWAMLACMLFLGSMPLNFTRAAEVKPVGGKGDPSPGKPVRVQREADLRAQLLAAQEAEAWPSVAEIAWRLLATAPRDPDLWEARAQALARMKDWIRCGETLDRWEKAAVPRRAVIADLRGDIASAQDDDDAAIVAWNESVRLAPKATDTMDKLAQTLMQTGEWKDAERVLERRAKVEPAAAPLARLATCRAELREWKHALAEIQRASSLDATNDEVHSTLPRLERLEKALPRIEKLERAAAADPHEVTPRLDLALIFAGAEWPHLALADAEQALRIAPTSRAGLLLQGASLLALGRRDDAEKLGINVSVALPSDADLHELAALDAKLRASPQTVEHFAQRSELLNRFRHFTLALKDADAAVKIDGASDLAHLARGRALVGEEGALEALPELIKATELNPKNQQAWLHRGEAEALLTDYRAAIASLTRVLVLDKKNLGALTQRERAFRALGKNIEAAEDVARLRVLKQ